MILLASFAKVRRAAVDLAACCCVWCSGRRAAAPAPSRRPAASGQRSYAPPAQPRRLFAVSLLFSGWRSWLRCQLLRSVRRWVRVRVGRAVRLVRFAVSFFCAGCMGFTPGVSVLRRVWRALICTTIPPRRFKRGAGARQKRLRGVGGRPAKDARRVCALKPPAAVFGLSCITFVSSRARFCSIFSGRGGSHPTHLRVHNRQSAVSESQNLVGKDDKVGAFAHSLHEAQQAPTGWRRSFVAARPAANSGQGERATKKDPRQG